MTTSLWTYVHGLLIFRVKNTPFNGKIINPQPYRKDVIYERIKDYVW